jgi:hypothetical protein
MSAGGADERTSSERADPRTRAATLVVTIDAAPLEHAQVDVLVAPFFASDRPLRGPAARIDWRLCGLLSERLAEQRVAGALGDGVLLPSGGRLRAPLLLALGLGPKDAFRTSTLRRAGHEAVRRLIALRAGVGAIALLADESVGLPAGTAAGALIEGAADALAEQPSALALRLIVAPGQATEARRGAAEVAPRAAVPLRVMRPEEPASARATPGAPGRARLGAERREGPEGAPRPPSTLAGTGRS